MRLASGKAPFVPELVFGRLPVRAILTSLVRVLKHVTVSHTPERAELWHRVRWIPFHDLDRDLHLVMQLFGKRNPRRSRGSTSAPSSSPLPSLVSPGTSMPPSTGIDAGPVELGPDLYSPAFGRYISWPPLIR
jgi:hypothetical protein